MLTAGEEGTASNSTGVQRPEAERQTTTQTHTVKPQQLFTSSDPNGHEPALG